MLGITPQHPKTKVVKSTLKGVLQNARRITTDSIMLNTIDGVLDTDSSDLCLYHGTLNLRVSELEL